MRKVAPLGESDLVLVRKLLYVRELPAGSFFLRAGDVASQVALVRKGVLREAFPLSDGGERTRGFARAGDLAGSLSDLLRGEPARTLVQVEADTRLVCMPWKSLLAVVQRNAAWRELLHRVTQRLYLVKAEREHELLGMDAEERYARFRARYPGLEAEVTQRHVASYVGITPEHLSRIRARALRRAQSSAGKTRA
jgi:CRP-like cAMP-binding protein